MAHRYARTVFRDAAQANTQTKRRAMKSCASLPMLARKSPGTRSRRRRSRLVRRRWSFSTYRRNSLRSSASALFNAMPHTKAATSSGPRWPAQSSPAHKSALRNKKAAGSSRTAAQARATTKSASSWLSTHSSLPSRSLRHGGCPNSATASRAGKISSTMLRSMVFPSLLPRRSPGLWMPTWLTAATKLVWRNTQISH
ncbi:hypothetical protein IG631_09031 [Alternaria alternata]|nr:hypothetical protein IG631_09031 [Alternaria alternata]